MNKFEKSIKDLERALSFLDKAKKDHFYYAGIAKSFETCWEYAWKHLKRKITEEGLEATSPKEAIKIAGKLKIIQNVEKWIDFLEDRNLAVHDYLGMDPKDYLKTIQEFFKEVGRISPR